MKNSSVLPEGYLNYLKSLLPSLLLTFLIACSGNEQEQQVQSVPVPNGKLGISLLVLGNVQDAGSPQIGCTKDCCKQLFEHPDNDRMVVSLGIIDAINNKNFLIEATPDIVRQSKILRSYTAFSKKEIPDGIFLTHAHIGHYAGLMYLGKEAMNAQQIPVYAMPRMKLFLENNGPWSQLVNNKKKYKDRANCSRRNPATHRRPVHHAFYRTPPG